jgi:biopolymer transport protein ExbB
MKTEPWGSHGGRRVARSAPIKALPFRFCIFAMLAALLPLIAFAHSASAQTNTPAPARPRPHAAAPRPATAAQAPAMTPASPFPNPSPPVAGPATTAANPSMPPAAMPAPPADAAATAPAPPSPPANTAAPGADTGRANAPAPSTNAPSTTAPPVAPAPPGETSISTAELPQDLSPWGMFVHADIIVKLVMIGLAIASLVTWTVWLAKWLELRSARTAVRRDLRTLENCPTLSQAHEQLRNGTSPTAFLMQAAGNEIRLSASLRGDGLKERIAWQLERIEQAASRKMARGTGVLATIGSTAPFVGLFGTVWGIMDSFIGISKAHTTNLAVVAPGIAEALLATALGLVAAIPAVMIYNVLARSTAQYRALLGDASAQVMKLVSRDLDRAKLPLSQAAE